MPDTLVVNLFGGPGSGKSTTACSAFSHIKLAGVNCELAPEYAKECVWDGTHHILQQNPIASFAEQHKRIHRLIGKVDVVITDSPLLLQIFYQRWSPELDALVLAEHNRHPSINFWIERAKPYHQAGRMQNEKQALVVDSDLSHRLDDWGVPLVYVEGDDTAGMIVADIVLKELRGKNE